MKVILSLFLVSVALFTVFLTSCTTKNRAATAFEKSGIRCDFDLGDYRLKYPGVLAMPYENKKRAVFADSLGHLDTFDISFVSKRRGKQLHRIYNGFVQGDTVRYCYITQYYHCLLESKKLKLQFKITVAARPLCLDEQRICPDADSKTPVDIIDVDYCDVAVRPKYHYGIFHKVIGSPSNTSRYGERLVYPEMEFFGRKFKAVERIDSSKKKAYLEAAGSRLYYSTSDGIVAFSINGGRVWRLEALY